MSGAACSATLVVVEPPSQQELRDARTVEIAFALVAGGVVVVVLAVGTWLTGRLLGLGGPSWEQARGIVLVVATVLGASTSLALLLRAGRRGL